MVDAGRYLDAVQFARLIAPYGRALWGTCVGGRPGDPRRRRRVHHAQVVMHRIAAGMVQSVRLVATGRHEARAGLRWRTAEQPA
jgi:hypothetical protein